MRQSLGPELDDLDPSDPSVAAMAANLRRDCIDAKEALSCDTDATVVVTLPSVCVRCASRGELETMISPSLGRTVEGLQRALDSAGIVAGDLRAVLLVGGSSRIPLVAQLVTGALGRPVAVDTHPKHAVALGAALRLAAEATAGGGQPEVPPPFRSRPSVSGLHPRAAPRLRHRRRRHRRPSPRRWSRHRRAGAGTLGSRASPSLMAFALIAESSAVVLLRPKCGGQRGLPRAEEQHRQQSVHAQLVEGDSPIAYRPRRRPPPR